MIGSGTRCRSQQDGNQTVAKSPDHKAVENLVMQYRVERAAKWMGKFAFVVFAMVLVAAVASLSTRKYL
jgi:hypothetical protein